MRFNTAKYLPPGEAQDKETSGLLWIYCIHVALHANNVSARIEYSWRPEPVTQAND